MAEIRQITGVKELVSKLTQMREESDPKKLGEGLSQAGLWLLAASQKIVPVQHGFLKASGRTRKEGGGLDVQVIVSYGTDYAVWVHENKDAWHGDDFNKLYSKEIAEAPPTHPKWFLRGPDQQAKFLEDPMREGRRHMQDIIKKAMRSK